MIDEHVDLIKEADWLGQFFSPKELACKHCGQVKVSGVLLDFLDRIRIKVGGPLQISSGYRCPLHNALVSHTGTTGPHTTGYAADIVCSGKLAYKVLAAAFELGVTGIGVHQRGNHATRFIHIDLLEKPQAFRPTIWTY